MRREERLHRTQRVEGIEQKGVRGNLSVRKKV
jgi:hypothetical protein